LIHVTNTRLEHVQALEEIQRLVFGHLPEIAQFTAAMYSRHIEIFPEGQFTALMTENEHSVVAGATTTFRTADFDHIRHPFDGSTSWLSDHDAEGEWLYGVDISVHPRYQRRGVATQIYTARAALVKRLNLRGEVAAGLLAGYHNHRTNLTIEQYVEKVTTGKLIDPTVSSQMRNGFVVRDILYNYVDNPQANNCAALIVRENIHYLPR
jgi:GNAT superfamily N-acetyltransferase